MINDVDTLRRRLHTLTRAADRFRQHARDLHDLGWEAHRGDDAGKVNGGATDHAPRAGDPRARALFAEICAEADRSEAVLVGLSRQMMALFTARAERPDPTRGSTISVAEFDERVAKQKTRDDTPARLEPQPQHPGRRR